MCVFGWIVGFKGLGGGGGVKSEGKKGKGFSTSHRDYGPMLFNANLAVGHIRKMSRLRFPQIVFYTADIEYTSLS